MMSALEVLLGRRHRAEAGIGGFHLLSVRFVGRFLVVHGVVVLLRASHSGHDEGLSVGSAEGQGVGEEVGAGVGAWHQKQSPARGQACVVWLLQAVFVIVDQLVTLTALGVDVGDLEGLVGT